MLLDTIARPMLVWSFTAPIAFLIVLGAIAVVQFFFLCFVFLRSGC
jgi:hypothetical protein